jgi:hypothetical protein
MSFSKKKEPGVKMSHVAKSLQEVARHLGKSLRQTQRYARAGMPRISGGYDLHQVEIWLKSAKYSGSSLRRLEQESLAADLFDLAVLELRQGLQHLCQVFIMARGKTRVRLVERALKGILQGTMQQCSLLEGREGEAEADR